MKKAISIISAIMYLLLSTGIFVSIHYCHDHFQDLKLYGTYDNDGCHDSCSLSHRCCTFDTISGKITQEHFGEELRKSVSPKEILVTIFSFESEIENKIPGIIFPDVIAPSPSPDIPLLNCSFIFYG